MAGHGVRPVAEPLASALLRAAGGLAEHPLVFRKRRGAYFVLPFHRSGNLGAGVYVYVPSGGGGVELGYVYFERDSIGRVRFRSVFRTGRAGGLESVLSTDTLADMIRSALSSLDAPVPTGVSGPVAKLRYRNAPGPLGEAVVTVRSGDPLAVFRNLTRGLPEPFHVVDNRSGWVTHRYWLLPLHLTGGLPALHRAVLRLLARFS